MATLTRATTETIAATTTTFRAGGHAGQGSPTSITAPLYDPHIIPNVPADEIRCFEKQRQEHKLGIMLVSISLLFILCQSFKIIPDLYEVLVCESEHCDTTPFVQTCINLSHLLVCFNSSANFVIYLLGGEKFRRVWCETYCSPLIGSSKCCLCCTCMAKPGEGPIQTIALRSEFEGDDVCPTATTASQGNLGSSRYSLTRT